MRKSLFVVALFLVVALLATMTFAQRDDEYDEAFFNVVDQVKAGLLPPEILDEYEAGTPALADDLSLDIDRVPLDLDRIPLDLSDLSIPVGIIDDAQLRRIVNEDGIPLEKLFSDEDTPDYAVRVDGRIVTQELLNELLNDLEDEVDIDATLERFEALQRMQNPTPRFDDADIVVRNADGFLQQDATNLISITPSFDVATPSAEGHQRYTFSFTIISKVWLPYFTIHMAQPEHYSFSGQFGTCTINGFQVDPVLLTAESRDDLVKSIFFDTPIDAAMTTVIECRDAVLQGAASAQPSDAVMFVESSTSHAATGEDMVLLSETNFDRKLPRTTWYYIFGMVLLSVVALTVGILALVAYQKKKNGAATTINKAGAKIVDTSAEKAKPEEQQSLLSAPDQQPYVSIV